MILKHLYLYLNREEFPHEDARIFSFNTRYLCNFVERRLKQIKFQTDGFSKICIQGVISSGNVCEVIPDNALFCKVLFNLNEYGALSKNQQTEYFIKILISGLENCSAHFNIPKNEIIESINEFRQTGFKNVWLHQSKSIKDFGIKATLICNLEVDKFELLLKLENKNGVLLEKKILETLPDEIIYQYKFKEMIVDGNQLIVIDKFGDKLHVQDLAFFRRNGLGSE